METNIKEEPLIHSFTVLERITNTLLLNSSFIDNLGLMHGKMGISIFFFHLARQTKNKNYEDYAGELIDEIYDEISANTPLDFENGLAGIGWGIEYLVQNKFIEADTDEVLEDFDNRICKETLYNSTQEIGLLNGLIGIGAYYLMRVQISVANDENSTTLKNKKMLSHVIDELERRTQDVSGFLVEPMTTIKTTNNTTSNIFDLLWDYPLLLWFTAELLKHNIFNSKVENIIQRLLEPLFDENNLPKLYGNRLALMLALAKLYQALETKKHQIIRLPNFSMLSNILLAGIERDNILPETLEMKASLRYGTAGVAWIYKQLLCLTKNKYYENEIQFWLSQNKFIELEINKSSSKNDKIDPLEKSYGILEGFAGCMFIEHVN